MIKAKKGLLIALFAALMVFAFGATSAFAAGLPADAVCTWSDNYHKVTVTNVAEHNNTTYNAKVTFNDSGMITATTVDVPQEVAWAAPEVSYNFYDLAGAVFCHDNTAIVGTYDNGQSNSDAIYPGANKLKLVEPSYTTDYDAADPKSAVVAASNGLVNYKGTIKETPAYNSQELEQQQFELTFSGSYNSAYDGTAARPEILNAVPSKTVTILAKTPVITDATFYRDSVANTNKIGPYRDAAYDVSFKYDGAEHSIVMAPLEGFSVAYSVLNQTTGKWDSVDAVKITDVADAAVQAKAVITQDSDKTKTKTQLFNVSVAPAEGAGFGFDPDGNVGSYKYYVESEIVDPADFVIATAGYYNYTYRNGRWTKGAWVDGDKSDKAAVAANEAELKAYFKDFYVIESTSTKAEPEKSTLTIKPNENLTAEEAAALHKKYEQLEANFFGFDLSSGGYWPSTQHTGGLVLLDSGTGAEMYTPVVINDKDDDITFSYAPNATYHVKKAKKLKKTKSFTVAAEAKSGNAISYKLTTPNKKISIDSATGKITVKKGLKKGTYKVTVKAVTDAGNGYKACKESVKLTIKIKK